jgi:hypothetical protein
MALSSYRRARVRPRLSEALRGLLGRNTALSSSRVSGMPIIRGYGTKGSIHERKGLLLLYIYISKGP